MVSSRLGCSLFQKMGGSDATPSCPLLCIVPQVFFFSFLCRIIPRTGTLAGAEGLWLTMQVSRGCPGEAGVVGDVETRGHPFS